MTHRITHKKAESSDRALILVDSLRVIGALAIALGHFNFQTLPQIAAKCSYPLGRRLPFCGTKVYYPGGDFWVSVMFAHSFREGPVSNIDAVTWVQRRLGKLLALWLIGICLNASCAMNALPFFKPWNRVVRNAWNGDTVVTFQGTLWFIEDSSI